MIYKDSIEIDGNLVSTHFTYIRIMFENEKVFAAIYFFGETFMKFHHAKKLRTFRRSITIN